LILALPFCSNADIPGNLVFFFILVLGPRNFSDPFLEISLTEVEKWGSWELGEGVRKGERRVQSPSLVTP
jgi:hypothetical protein